MSSFVSFNGKIIKEADVRISPRNRSFRYGDGFFETMRIVDKRIPLIELHLHRMFHSLKALHFSVPMHLKPQFHIDNIQELLHANNVKTGKARLMVFRGEGGLFEAINNEPNILIEAIPHPAEVIEINSSGLSLDVFRDGRKNYDLYSALKTNNYLPYLMGAKWARNNLLDDCILLNAFEHVVETTFANIFIVHDQELLTPALTEGCVAGVMRNYIISWCKRNHISCTETQISLEQLYQAQEVFVTNAYVGLKWVAKIGEHNFLHQFSARLYKNCIAPIWR